MGHQIKLEEVQDFKFEYIVAMSTKDKKKLIARGSIAGVQYAVEKDGLTKLFVNLPAAVKHYNG